MHAQAGPYPAPSLIYVIVVSQVMTVLFQIMDILRKKIL